MKPSELKTLISNRFKAGIRRPILVESIPGLGKTQIAAQVAEDLGVGFLAIHAPLLQPEDYGFPVISAKRDDVNFVVSKAKFPVEGSDFPEQGIFLVDELSQADASAQKILANLFQEREIHGEKIKPGWMMIATGNRTTDRAGANRILSHLGNRVTRVTLEASIDDWIQWALTTGEVKTEVIAFIRFKPALLANFDPQQDINATPRAWSEGVSATLGAIPSELEFESFKGDVGEGAASEFIAFVKIARELPSVDKVLLNPTKESVPKDGSARYAITGALAHVTTGANFSRAMKYIERLPAEFSVLFVRDVTARDPDICNTKTFIEWASGPGAELVLSPKKSRK